MLALISANRANISGDLALISGPFAVYALNYEALIYILALTKVVSANSAN